MSRDSSMGTDAGGEVTGHDAVEGELQALEDALLDPEFRGTAQATELLADDFVEFGSSGHTFDKQSVVAALAEERPVERRLSGFRVRLLTPTMALSTSQFGWCVLSAQFGLASG